MAKVVRPETSRVPCVRLQQPAGRVGDGAQGRVHRLGVREKFGDIRREYDGARSLHPPGRMLATDAAAEVVFPQHFRFRHRINFRLHTASSP
jgi:hypothetical protein